VHANALLHIAEHRVACRETEIRPPAAGEVLVQSLYSALSPGTEAMIFRGAFPRDAPLDTSLESLAGTFAYPFAYGYALVGRVVQLGPGADANLRDALVFLFHPHQDRVTIPASACHRIPPGISPQDALCLPQVETAVNLVLDGAPLIGERVLVFGLGLVGLLTAALLARFPLARLIAIEPLAVRRELAAGWGIAEAVDPHDADQWRAVRGELGEADLAFELSGQMAALDSAIESVGFDGRIVVGSWYGSARSPLDLGNRFHRNRLRLVSSQVSTLAPRLSGRWDKARRLALAWRMLGSLDCQRLPRRWFPLSHCQQAFEALCEHPADAMQIALHYDA
jgi:2-desacetyl-2-hydroxyethyl bacteriochlorophyllide A dehydrogenase